MGQDSPDVQCPIVRDGQPNDGELEETEEGRPVSCWKNASCVEIPLAVRGGGGHSETVGWLGMPKNRIALFLFLIPT